MSDTQFSNLYSLDLEKHCLAGAIQYPDILSEIDNFISKETFCAKPHQIIYNVWKQTVLKREKYDSMFLAEKINQLNIKFKDDLSPYDYIDSISSFTINKDACLENFKELAKLKALRELYKNADKVKAKIIEERSKPLSEIVSNIDKINNEKISSFYTDEKEFSNIYEGLEEKIEEIADNPPDDSKFMYGPFNTVNRIYGSLHRPGNITMIAARTSVGKSNLGLFYNTFISDQYNIPCLNLDNGELSLHELQMRAACMMTKGKVPYHALEHGYWRNKSEWEKMVREVWPKVKKLKFYYKQIASLNPQETISTIRRFAYNTVGRGNPFTVNFDYLKPFNTSDYNIAEYKELGHYIQDVKSFITNEIEIPFWCSIQQNRTGIVKNKLSVDQIDDSDNSIGLSDRITQQTSHTFIMREKIMEELAYENCEFGNLVLKNVKKRHLGKDYFDAINPVECEDGKRRQNYINLNQDSFYFEDMGDLKEMTERLKERYDVQGEEDDSHPQLI